ncbi:hypothetical protein [Psychrobacter sp. K31L]|uniref:hypothetical protein n=1 Tax=Psychrobacter sp. K31L TaxID=2820758 RepID=UPI001B3452E1|nr:hypothetical protein [Psychrobacter sp. K31L]MBP3945154.1 hypothetical protein [Psychrobacter sp. K31L]
MKQLTQADLIKAPKRINSAAIDENGDAWGYSAYKQDLKHNHKRWSDDTLNCDFWFIGEGFDTTDWQNSAIDRESAK